MLKKIFLFSLLALPSAAIAISSIPVEQQGFDYRVDYLQLRLPNQSKQLGLMGVHALAKLNPYFYAGIGGYAAVKGQNSGFFALGLDASVQHPIVGPIWGDAGLFLGSGGGNGLASSIGNGGFLESHVGLQYDFGPARLEANFSHLKFLDAHINDNQLSLAVNIPVNFVYTLAHESGQTIQSLKDFSLEHLQFQRDYIALTANAYFPHKGTKNLDGQIMDGHAGLVGAEFGHYFTPNASLFGEVNGAVTGNKNGYADAIAGMGYQWPLAERFKLVTRLGVGSGGGGSVNMGGGFLMQPQLGLEIDPTDSIGIEALGGYLWAPSSGYRAWTAGLHLKYYFNEATTDDQYNIPTNRYAIHKWRIRVGNQLYINPQRENPSDQNKKMNLLALKFDYFACPNLYLTGQTAFAYTGNAAGYFSGLVGVGVQSPNWGPAYLYAELLGGAAGGAGLEIGTGKMIEPLIGLGAHLTPQFGAYASIGWTLSPNNNLKTTTIDAGLSWRFGTITGD